MRTRSFGTIIVGDICVHPGYRMGQEYRHVETQKIEFGNSSAENSLNIPWNITNEGCSRRWSQSLRLCLSGSSDRIV